MKMVVFWDVTPCSRIDIDRRFGSAYSLRRSIFAGLYGVKSQKTAIFTIGTMEISPHIACLNNFRHPANAMEACSPHGKIWQNQLLSEQTEPHFRSPFHNFMTWYKFIKNNYLQFCGFRTDNGLLLLYCYFSELVIHNNSNFTWT
jgi:hypothetical protein